MHIKNLFECILFFSKKLFKILDLIESADKVDDEKENTEELDFVGLDKKWNDLMYEVKKTIEEVSQILTRIEVKRINDIRFESISSFLHKLMDEYPFSKS